MAADKKKDTTEEEETQEAPKSKGGMMKMIIIINVVVVLLLVGVVVTMFLMKDGHEKKSDKEVLETEAVAEEEKPAGNAKNAKPIYVPLTPPFVVNFENQDQEVAFLQVEIELMTYDQAVVESVKTHNPRIRNELLLLLGGQQYHEINTPDGKRKLAQQALESIVKVLEDSGDASGVESVLFTSFVMQ